MAYQSKIKLFRYASLACLVAVVISILTVEIINIQKDRVILNYVNWITENSILEYNGEDFPEIVKIPKSEMAILYYGLDPNPDNHSKLEKEVVEDSKVAALYNNQINTMYFQPDFSVRDWETTHILVHELVHFLQKTSGMYDGDPCIPKLEAMAYVIQAIWQLEHDHPARLPSRILILSLQATNCSR